MKPLYLPTIAAPVSLSLQPVRVTPPDCPHCDTAQKPELLAHDGQAPHRIWVWLCPSCSRTWRVEESDDEGSPAAGN